MSASNLPASSPVSHEIIIRSSVEKRGSYTEYREELRHDFFYSCGYCTMTEAEAQAVRYAIDHYHPRGERSDLVNAYENLMWSCDPCNMRKSDRVPSDAAKKAGLRYFRPDKDVRSAHFKCEDVELEAKTDIGDYTIDELDLNSARLRRLRDLRRRISSCAQLVEQGVVGLRDFQYDQLPPGIRGQAVSSIGRARNLAEDLLDDIDTTLRRSARSQMIDPDDGPDAQERAAKRVAKIKAREGLYPGNWRAPRTKKK